MPSLKEKHKMDSDDLNLVLFIFFNYEIEHILRDRPL